LAFENGIADRRTDQKLGHGMADKLGHAQHPLRRPAARLVVNSGHGCAKLIGFDLGRSFAAKRDHSLHGANGRTFGSGVYLLIKGGLHECQQEN
jgi:hypothetical protein